MGEVEDAHGLRAVQIDKALDPLRPIADGGDLARRLPPAPVQLQQHRVVEVLDVR
jgi:hypothetical protein